MTGRRAPLSGGMRVVEEPIPEDDKVLAGEPANPGGSGYWAFVAWWFWLLIKLVALLGLVAGFWGLWLAASAVWGWIL